MNPGRSTAGMKKPLLYFMLFVLVTGISYADDDFDAAKKIINSKTPCSRLNESQLETLGDYYMELMHPGELHEYMELMMGGEGSESLKAAHIAMAQRFYCLNESSSYMMGVYGGMTGRRGMMDRAYNYDYTSPMYMNNHGGMMKMMGYSGYGMMGGYGYFGINSLLVTALLIGLVILVYMWIAKLWKEGKAKK